MVARERTENEANVTQSNAPGLSAEDAIKAAMGATASVADSAEPTIDDRGFTRVFDKSVLVGKPFTIVDYDQVPGEFGMMSVVHAVSGKQAFYFQDGGTGIPDQLLKLREKGLTQLIRCPRGLRKSTYKNPHGEGMSTTFYIDDETIV
jgi:hypothetical protein